MRKKYLKFVSILVVLTVSTLAFFLSQNLYNSIKEAEHTSDVTDTAKHLYTDPQYGFSFEYPNDMTIEKTETSIKIKRKDAYYAEFNLPELYIGKPSDLNLDFEGYAEHFAKTMCDASGPMENIYCDRVESTTSIKNFSGLTVLKVILREVTENYMQQKLFDRLKEPIYAIDVEGLLAGYKLILLVPNENAKDKEQTEILESILRSLVF